MTCLGDQIAISERFATSANIERDVEKVEPLDGYVVTGRALEVVNRVAHQAVTGRGGAWSVTGPYGSGKSSLALIIDAILGPNGAVRDRAIALMSESSAPVSSLIRKLHGIHRTEDAGFNRGLITANREPITHTVARALHSAVCRRYGSLPTARKFRSSPALRSALQDLASNDPRHTGPSPTALLEVAVCLASSQPLVLLIDEFGKNLEAAGDSAASDPFLLQQLAEAGQQEEAPIFTITLQHLSFEDYFSTADSTKHREWAKVQGRFEDIPYVDSPAQTRSLIRTVLQVDDPKLRSSVSRWAKTQAPFLRQLSIGDLDAPAIAGSYPLHPLAVAVLPELCARYGQNERTLFSFLTGSDPRSVASKINTMKSPARGAPPTVGLADLYDYFVDGGLVENASPSRGGRWTEITTRLRDAHGLSPPQTNLAKCIAVLNLVSTTGSLRASRNVIAQLSSDALELCAELESLGIITYREFADEYRIWQGTDLDIRLLMDAALNAVQQQPLVDVVRSVDVIHPGFRAGSKDWSKYGIHGFGDRAGGDVSALFG